MELSDKQWNERLTEEQYRILRKKGTEPAFSGKFYDFHGEGTYCCAGCGSPLFDSKSKYDSGSGWPSFTAPIEEKNVEYSSDFALLTPRTEVLCANCHGHLGHVFDDGPKPIRKRYCINSLALNFKERS